MTKDAADPRRMLVDVLRASTELLALPENDFSWSSWKDRDAALDEMELLLSAVESGDQLDRLAFAVLFAATGPIGEVGLSSGWAEAYLIVAEQFDRVERMLWPAK